MEKTTIEQAMITPTVIIAAIKASSKGNNRVPLYPHCT